MTKSLALTRQRKAKRNCLLQAVRASIINYPSDHLLHKDYFTMPQRTPTAGHCYIASEALYHLLSKADREIFKPHYIKVEGTTHWYLANADKSQVLDPTKDQFYPMLVNYEDGKCSGFLTKEPSKRSIVLIRRSKAFLINLRERLKNGRTTNS
jgi:hypothetical protein